MAKQRTLTSIYAVTLATVLLAKRGAQTLLQRAAAPAQAPGDTPSLDDDQRARRTDSADALPTTTWTARSRRLARGYEQLLP